MMKSESQVEIQNKVQSKEEHIEVNVSLPKLPPTSSSDEPGPSNRGQHLSRSSDSKENISLGKKIFYLYRMTLLRFIMFEDYVFNTFSTEYILLQLSMTILKSLSQFVWPELI